MESPTTLKELKPNMKPGDIIAVSVILECTRDAAQKRLSRGNIVALEVLRKLIDQRDNSIEELKEEFKNSKHD